MTETQRQSFSYFRQTTQSLNSFTNSDFSSIFLIWKFLQRAKLLWRIPHFRIHLFWLGGNFGDIIVAEYWDGWLDTWECWNILTQWITLHWWLLLTNGLISDYKTISYTYSHKNDQSHKRLFSLVFLIFWTATFLCWIIRRADVWWSYCHCSAS